jgi:hypothetical protein
MYEELRKLNHNPYYLTPWRRVLPERVTDPQLVKKFPVLYGTQWFISIYTKSHVCPYPEPDKSSPCLPIPLTERSILKLSSKLSFH